MNKKENKDTLCNGSLFTLKRNFTMLYLQPFFYKGPEIFSGASRSEFAMYAEFEKMIQPEAFNFQFIQFKKKRTKQYIRAGGIIKDQSPILAYDLFPKIVELSLAK